jgi:tRNA (adenine57-N1/adenine58-N1)-methyltransferase catalytic subunit
MSSYTQRITGSMLHNNKNNKTAGGFDVDTKNTNDDDDDVNNINNSNSSSMMTMKEGDLVIVHVGFNDQKQIRLNRKETMHTHYGAFKHCDIINKVEFGQKVTCKTGFVWLLAPTAELWTNVLAHRTQILYVYDIALICSWMDLKPGKVVLESGTGSGSLTHSLVRAVANPRTESVKNDNNTNEKEDNNKEDDDAHEKEGHVFTFEFNKVRADAAHLEIQENGLSEFCTVTHRDIETNGFSKNLEEAKIADAVFLDLPGPYKCVESAAKCLKVDGVLCSFSPCVEQVQKTCIELTKFGFCDIKTVEMLGREFDVSERRFYTNIETASAGKSFFEKNKRGGGVSSTSNSMNKNNGLKAAENGSDDFSHMVSSIPRLQGQTHTGYLTFARLAPVPEGWTKESWIERSEKKRETGKDILKAKFERDGVKNEKKKTSMMTTTAAATRKKRVNDNNNNNDNRDDDDDEDKKEKRIKTIAVAVHNDDEHDEYSD